MATNLQRRGFASFGKRFLQRNYCWIMTSFQLSTPTPTSLSASYSSSSSADFSVYEKNVDDGLGPNAVPDEVIQPHINNYWAPHPQTGVFGPTDPSSSDHQPLPQEAAAAAAAAQEAAAAAAAVRGSVLEHKAWFHPLEDVDRPTTTLE